MHLYVYYEVPHGAVRATGERVRAMQAGLGTPGRLMRRDPVGAGAETWMEIYDDVAPGFEALLAARADAGGLATLAGPRHVERFVDLD